MSAILIFLYSLLAYAAFLASFLYLIAFVGNLWVPRSVDVGPDTPMLLALTINLGVIVLFGVQHTVMARAWFKEWITNVIPWAAERSTYVLASSITLFLMYWCWRPMPAELWRIEVPAGVFVMNMLFWAGWAIAFIASWLISHFDLFGLSQAWINLRGTVYQEPGFSTPLLYAFVRHPLQTGFLIAFWATPVMTAGHVVFSLGMTAYILVGVWFEEKDLINLFGVRYRDYRQRVPKLIPWKVPIALMPQQRSLSRIKITYYLRVFDNETDSLLGHVGDINVGGLMLIGDRSIEILRMYSLRMAIPANDHKTEHILLEAESVWSRKDTNPYFYDTGFRLIDPTPNSVRMIRQLIDEMTL